VDGLCREGIQRAARSLFRAFEYGQDEKAREDMSIASLFGGLALANGKLGVVHAIAGPMGGMFPIPHGTACACLLPHGIEVNITALRNSQESEEKLQRYEEIARLITGNNNATIDDGIAWIKGLCLDLKIPRLSEFGITRSDFPSLIEKSLKASSMKGNPVKLTSSEIDIILNDAI
jgi:alcohol dehydrogenase class IV